MARREVLAVLRDVGGEPAEAARRLGTTRVSLWRALKRLGLTETPKRIQQAFVNRYRLFDASAP